MSDTNHRYDSFAIVLEENSLGRIMKLTENALLIIYIGVWHQWMLKQNDYYKP